MKIVSGILIFIGFLILAFIFAPVLTQEAKYQFDQISHVQYVVGTEQLSTFQKPLIPPNMDFSIMIPKIGAVAPVIANVDATNSINYLPALRKGVAQASGTAYPGEIGNIFLFAHSTDAFYDVSRYNAVFFLIGKLNSGDEIDIYFKSNLYKYSVYDKQVVSADSSQYLGTLIQGEQTLTLQTCYPPGTTLERLVVLAKRLSD